MPGTGNSDAGRTAALAFRNGEVYYTAFPISSNGHDSSLQPGYKCNSHYPKRCVANTDGTCVWIVTVKGSITPFAIGALGLIHGGVHSGDVPNLRFMI